MKNRLRQLRALWGRRVVRDGGWIATGMASSVLARLVGLRLLTELLAPDRYAEVVLLIGLATLGANVLCAPFLESTLRFYPEAARVGTVPVLRRMLSQMLRWRASLVAVLLLVGGGVWTWLFEPLPGVLAFALLAVFLVLDQWRAFEQALLNAARRQSVYSLWTSLDVWLRPLLAAGAVVLLGAEASPVLLGYALALLLGNLVFRRFAVRAAPAPADASAVVDAGAWHGTTRAEIIHYATPLIPLAVLGWVMTLSDRYLVAGLVSASEAGIYAAAYGLASQPFITLAGILSRTLRPVFNEAVARDDAARQRQTLLLWLGAALVSLSVGWALLVAFSGWLVELVLGEAFWDAVRFLPWIAASYVIQGLQQAFEAVIFAQRRTRRFLVVWGISSVTALGLYLLWIPAYGAMGAAMATLVALCASCLTTIVLSGAVPRLLQGRPLGEEPPAA